jgi:hypothetical protein
MRAVRKNEFYIMFSECGFFYFYIHSDGTERLDGIPMPRAGNSENRHNLNQTINF